MALRGTLKDFGIAEIFQLIGGQGKSGVLYLESKKGKLRLSFDKGSIVDVEAGSRHRGSSLADLLVRAEVCTPAQIKEALAIQKKTLRRLADIVRDQGWAEPDVLKEMTALETNEALYGLFTWTDGTYRFEPGEVHYDPKAVAPRSLEHFLMEGFRRMDEWPIIERRVGPFNTTFQVVAPLPEGDSDEIGWHERRVFSLIRPDRGVTKLIDLSRMGEFETCRALQHLLDIGCIRAAAAKVKGRRRGRAPRDGGMSARAVLEAVAKGVISLAAIILLFFLVWYANPNLSGLLRAPLEGTIGKTELGMLLGNAQITRLRAAIELFRLERGRYPEKLDELAAANLVAPEELRYPWEHPYYYQRADTYVLYRPGR
jgi:hypothetical protein